MAREPDPGDAANSSFDALNRPMLDVSPGDEEPERQQAAAGKNSSVQRPMAERDIPRASLAERIREREAG